MNTQTEQMVVESFRKASLCMPDLIREDSQAVTANLPSMPQTIGQMVYLAHVTANVTALRAKNDARVPLDRHNLGSSRQCSRKATYEPTAPSGTPRTS
jgi:hypothetical protein|eukprot:COSAG02_NODE_3546_length_6583_cov_2.799661_8_plen_98_part_00